MDNQLHEEFLKTFDSLEKDSLILRRLAYKPLYEFFKKIVFSVGVNLCYLHERTFKNLHLKPIWVDLKLRLFQIDSQLDEWNMLIKKIDKIRQGVEHNSDYDVNQNSLQDIRNKAPEFRTWILNTGREYYKKSKDFTFKEILYSQLTYHLLEIKVLVEEYGEAPHLLSHLNKEEYSQVPELINKVKSIKRKVSNLQDMTFQDFLDFLRLVQIIAKFRVIEENLLSKSICPKCSNKITQTPKYISGKYDEPPTVMQYRIGCESCDYTIYEDTVDI